MSEYIKREDVLDILSGKNAAWDGYQKVKELPTADVIEKKTGKWIDITELTMIYGLPNETIYRCSECNELFRPERGLFCYCPKCGAKMETIVQYRRLFE